MTIDGVPACRCESAGVPRRKLANALPVPSASDVRLVIGVVNWKYPRFWKNPSMSQLNLRASPPNFTECFPELQVTRSPNWKLLFQYWHGVQSSESPIGS